MRNIIISTISILSLITLTACTGSADGGDTPAANANANPPVTETPMDTETPMETPMKTDDLFPPIVTTGVPTQDLDGVTSFAPDDAHLKHIIALPVASMAQITTDTTDNSITTNNITGGAISYRYADGSFDTGFNTTSKAPRLYIGSSIYQVTAGTSSNLNSVSSTTVEIDDTEVAGATLRLFRNDSFGFIANYMARLDWVVGDTKGYGIAGFETGLHGGTLLNSGTTTFTGKGQGTYSDSDTSNLTLGFNITANVDLGTRMVTLESDTTCQIDYQGCPLNDANEYYNLNFKGSANYTSGTNALNFTNIATAGDDKNFDADDSTELNGVASARFYGGLTNEIGGTFNLINSDNSAGYVGFFGGERGWVISANPETATAAMIDGEPVPTGNALNPNNLENFTDSAKDGTTGNALSADFLQITRNSVDKSINNDIFTGGVVVFDYNGSNFATSGTPLTFYLGDRKYSATTSNASNVSTRINSNTSTNMSNDSDVPENLYFSIDDFGFTADYMALAYYNVMGTGYASEGFGIVGFETATPLGAGTTIFTGAGWGAYSDSSATIVTSFNINANVDFGNRTVSLASTGTCDNSDCTGLARADLNFTGDLTYGANTNALTSTATGITTTGDATYASLSGDATAKFYGPQSNELGGTFSLASGEAGYVGFFGGVRYIVEATDTTTTGAPTPATTLTSFKFSERSKQTGNILDVNNSVRITKHNADKTITSDVISGAVIEFDYNNDNDFKGNSIDVYFAGEKYTPTNANSVGTEGISSSSNSGGASNVTVDYLQLGVSIGAVGFASDYLASVRWDESHADFTSFGYGIAGFATDNVNPILSATSGSATFTGIGRGNYHDAGKDTFYRFIATANVDFGLHTIVLKSTDTCETADPTACNGNEAPAFDFKGDLTYNAGANAFTGTVTTAGTDEDHNALDGTELLGTANGKFYGPSVDELGGTFSLSNFGSSYVGFFTGERDWLVSTSEVARTIAVTAPTDITTITDYADGFDNSALTGAVIGTGNTKTIALNMSNAVQVRKNAGAKTIINHHYTGSVAQITYNEDGNITGVSAFFDDKKYSGTGSGDSTFISTVPTSSDGIAVSSLYLTRGSFNNFGFTAKYITTIAWTTGTYERGYAIAGFETTGSAIPTSNTATFTGRGAGIYYDDSGSNNVPRYFKLEAIVDFSDRDITFDTTETCTSSGFNNCGSGSHHLNMTGTLYYDANTNDLASMANGIETTGTVGGSKLTGDANARFYGPNAEELGGTFSVSNDSASFVGFFGAKE